MRAESAAPSLPLTLAWLAAFALLASIFLPAEVTSFGTISFYQSVTSHTGQQTTIEWLLSMLLLVGAAAAIVALTTQALEPGLEEAAGWAAFAGFAAALGSEVLWAIDLFTHFHQLGFIGASLGSGVWVGSIAAWLGLGASLYVAGAAHRARLPQPPPLPDYPLPGIYADGSEISDLPAAAMAAPVGAVARLSFVHNGKPMDVVVEAGERIIIGSADVADVRLPDPRVSPQQAMLEWRDGRWIVTDLTPGNPMDLVDSSGRSRRIYGRAIVGSGRLLIGDVGLTLHAGGTGPA